MKARPVAARVAVPQEQGSLNIPKVIWTAFTTAVVARRGRTKHHQKQIDMSSNIFQDRDSTWPEVEISALPFPETDAAAVVGKKQARSCMWQVAQRSSVVAVRRREQARCLGVRKQAIEVNAAKGSSEQEDFCTPVLGSKHNTACWLRLVGRRTLALSGSACT